MLNTSEFIGLALGMGFMLGWKGFNLYARLAKWMDDYLTWIFFLVIPLFAFAQAVASWWLFYTGVLTTIYCNQIGSWSDEFTLRDAGGRYFISSLVGFTCALMWHMTWPTVKNFFFKKKKKKAGTAEEFDPSQFDYVQKFRFEFGDTPKTTRSE